MKIKKRVEDYLINNSKRRFLLSHLHNFGNKENSEKKWILPHEVLQYEKRWKEYKSKYRKIVFYGIEFMGIGETIPRLFTYLSDSQKRNVGDYHIVLPIFSKTYLKGSIFNYKVFDIFGNKINFVMREDISFWQYVVLFHADYISIKKFDKYKYRRLGGFHVRLGEALHPLSEEIKQYGQKRMKEMGIEGEYICLHARDDASKKKNYSGDYEKTTSSNAKLSSFVLATQYLKEQNYQLVRMGKCEEEKCSLPGVIDYTKEFYEELMDFYLIANCKFMVGSASGLTAVTPFWGRPVLITNINILCYGHEALPYTDYDLYMLKKFYSKAKKRFLNLYEMLDVSNTCDRVDKRYEKIGIQVIDNTPEEILEAVKEMQSRLEGRWEITEEELDYRRKYTHIFKLWKERHKSVRIRKLMGAKGYQTIPDSIAFSYLKSNLYLLEMEENS